MLSTQVKKYLLISVITVVAIASAIIVGVSSGNKHDDSTSAATKLCLVSGNIVNEEDNKGIENVVVLLCDTTTYKEIDMSETNTAGKYEFEDVEVGQYYLKLVLPDTKYNGLGKQITFLIDGSKTNYTISTIKLSKSNGNWGPLT